MKKIGLAMLLLSTLLATVSHAQTSFRGTPNQIFKQIRQASNSLLYREVNAVAGQSDNWKTNSIFMKYAKNISFVQRWLEKRYLSRADFASFQNILQSGNINDALRNGFLIASQSQDSDLRSMAVTLKGEARELLDSSYLNTKREDLESNLFFLINMQNGDTQFEKDRFSRFGSSLNQMAYALQRAVRISQQHPLSAVLVELTTSSMDSYRSPVMSLLTDKILRGPNWGITPSPDGGKIVALAPSTAEALANELTSMAKNMEFVVKKFKYQVVVDKIAREQLIKILRTGTGIASDRPLFCSALFNLF